MDGFGKTAAKRIGLGAIVAVLAAACAGPAAATDRQVPGTRSALLNAVSCRSADFCVAVGADLPGLGADSLPLAEVFNGAAWSAMATPAAPGGAGSSLADVSCSAPNACMAVGSTDIPHGSSPFAQRWDGTAWTIVPTPGLPGGDSFLHDVSCATANACVAIGNAIRNSHNNTFAEVWNGRTWRLKAVRLPAGTTYSLLDDVSCTSARRCVAVGNYQLHDTSKDRTLAETWNGRTWRINRTPNPRSGPNGGALRGVSCGSARSCIAVGNYAKPSRTSGAPLAMRLRGGSWSTLGARAGALSLDAVSCASVGSCMAVGLDGNGVVAHTWTGRGWTPTPLPAQPGAAVSLVNGVSCSAPNACVAVGQYQTDPRSSQVLPTAAAWNGTAWTLTPTP